MDSSIRTFTIICLEIVMKFIYIFAPFDRPALTDGQLFGFLKKNQTMTFEGWLASGIPSDLFN